jgi:outer membrane protein assembly factor BamB
LVLRAEDWPQYRGPNHDGSSSETLRTNWVEQPPEIVWKKEIEPGWGSITVSGGRVYTQVNRRLSGQPREVCVALNADTGAELWAASLDQAYYPDAGTGNTDGPRSTPTVDGDRVFVFTSYLKLYCLRADNGEVVWRRDFIAEFSGTDVIDWQGAASPLIVGDLVFLNSNVANKCLMAVRKSDGVIVWGSEDANFTSISVQGGSVVFAWSGTSALQSADTVTGPYADVVGATSPRTVPVANGPKYYRFKQNDMTHATPVYATIAGTPQVIFLSLRGLVGVTPETGAVLWRYNFSPSTTSTAATPIVADDYVYASCAYSKGAWTARVTKSGAQFSVGQTDYTQSSSYQNHWATPVHHEGFLYSIVERSGHSLACFSLAGRTNRWITSTVGSRNPGYASLIKVGGKLLVLTERGELVLLEPNPEAYTEIARYQALSGTSWNHPAFSNGRIYARSSSQIVALNVAAALGGKLQAELPLSAETTSQFLRVRERVSLP